MACHLFTPESARETATKLEPLGVKLQTAYERLAAAAPQVRAEQSVGGAHLSELLNFYESLAALAAAGVVLCDPAKRQFELPARLRGRPVRLCWQLGSPHRIGWRDPSQSPQLLPVAGQSGWEEALPKRVG
jgi:hypothetical protein